jgi:hypothetical protein
MIVNGSILPNAFTFTWMKMKFDLQTKKTTLTAEQKTESVNFDSYSKWNGCQQISYIWYRLDLHDYGTDKSSLASK